MGRPAIFFAIQRGLNKVVDHLLSKNPDLIHAKNNNGKSALDLAHLKNNKELNEILAKHFPQSSTRQVLG
jgi:ankyrin repeat protein